MGTNPRASLHGVAGMQEKNTVPHLDHGSKVTDGQNGQMKIRKEKSEDQKNALKNRSQCRSQ